MLLAMALAGPAWAWDDRMPPEVYDPLIGLDLSGRIPRVPLPEDLPEPGRWRYVPEGRIKPGPPWRRLLVSTFVTPQIFFESDVGVGGGLALTDIDFRNERRREFLGAFLTYTSEGQQRYRLVWRRWLHHRDLPAGGVALEERSHIDLVGGYERTLTRRFFGLGPDTRADDETSYADAVWDAGARAQVALPGAGGDVIAHLGVRAERHDLAPGRVSGRATTDRAHPTLFAAGDRHEALGVSLGLRWDTRDSQHQPYTGLRLGVSADLAPWQSGGGAGGVFTAYGNVAVPLPPLLHRGGEGLEENPPTDTLALGVFVAATAGDLPFYDRPSLGGSHTLRGFIANRFTGDAAWHAAAEYRLWVIPRGFRLTDTIRIERVGLALFGEAGTVADDLAALGRARVHASAGVGLRITLERTALFRADLGLSREGVNFTLAFGLPF